MGKTFAEKILAQKSGRSEVRPGEIVTVRPDHLLSHDNTAAIVEKIAADLEKFGVADPDLHVVVLDHVVPAATEKDAQNHKSIREYVRKYGVRHFFDVGAGVCHQVMVEKGLALPGMLVVGSDSHTCMYGALGVFATGIDRTEASALILTGETWLKVPESVRIELRGRLLPGVTAKDLVLSIIGDIGADGANYQCVEFHGDIENLTMDDRLTVANMGVEMGAKAAVFPVDRIAEDFLESVCGAVVPPAKCSRDGCATKSEPLWADPDAEYTATHRYDLNQLGPVVAKPHTVDNVVKVEEIEGTPIDQFLIGTCTNGRTSDFELAASILKGKRIAEGVRLLLLPASREILRQTMASGAMAALMEAGGMLLPVGCGPCLGAHLGALAPGERCLSTSNRNFKGRMGCGKAEIFLASPATVAASALHGVIYDPRKET
jgi:3-isopropylmalate/(R)-2-methylmalate dehydratase large subunit